LPTRKQIRIFIGFIPLILMFGPTLFKRVVPLPYNAANRQLNAAILRSDTADVKAALKAGADPNTEMEGWAWTDGVFPLVAVINGDIHEHVRDTPLLMVNDSLVERDAKALDKPGGIPLDNPDIVKALVESGANVNARNHIGYTALFQATEWGYTSTAIYLLDHGADPNLATCGSDTPCSQAAMRADTRLLKELLSRGADPNIPDCLGDTALHMLSLGGDDKKHVETVELLMQCHANPRLKNRDGLTPAEFAKKNDSPNVAKALENY
jgi:hypothetical protein